MMFTEPKRVTALFQEELITQRHRLYTALAWVRILVASVALVYSIAFKSHGSNYWLVITIQASYILLVYGLILLSDSNRERIVWYNFLIAICEISLLGYLDYLSNDNLPLSFLFFSVVLCALLLPFSLTMLVFGMATLCIIANWLNLTAIFSEQHLSVDSDFITAFLKHYNAHDGQVLLMIIVGLFLLTIIVNRLASWSFSNDVKARFRHRQMRQVLSFNRAVIEHLKTGVIVVTDSGKVLSINGRAVLLLNLQAQVAVTELVDLSPELQRRFEQWLRIGMTAEPPYRHNNGAEEVFVNFEHFGDGGLRNIAMLTLESVDEIQQQSHDAKLAALGRLTAGVAHEIRNPLSSIHSAAQLLDEDGATPKQAKLTQMILKNVARTDQIISDILGLFNDAKANRKLLPLRATLERYAKDFLDVHHDKGFDKLSVEGNAPDNLYFYFDTGQLEQIIWNLLQNAIKYADAASLALTIQYSLSATKRQIYIDIMDNGHGVPEDRVGHIFEPFYTAGNGSGLGLYLVRELCSANNAKINYFPLRKDGEVAVSGACFRITTAAHFSQQEDQEGVE
ncbi:MAG: hypothetical protein CR974_01095 [Gammaproteobacteria bacterium]|nr:MAG: hypothetical protein CR974_01095 [Gammaproteobacteria bacterium]